MSVAQSYRDWHIPFTRDRITLRQARASLRAVGAGQQEVPIMVQLVENPKFSMPGFRLFHGAVDLKRHDDIHLALGRGLLPKDEAFAIGFTMGTSNKVSTAEEKLFGWISKHLHPGVYKFTDTDLRVFRDAVRLGFISDCHPLDEIDFEPFLDLELADIRRRIGLEADLILAYYAIEKRRFPESLESQRLLSE